MTCARFAAFCLMREFQRSSLSSIASVHRKRLRNTPQEIAAAQDGAAHVLDWLQCSLDLAEAVLTAPQAHESRTPLSLAPLYHALPEALHGFAARGYFGVSAATTWLHTTYAPALRASSRTLQLLPQQRSVMAVRLISYDRHRHACPDFAHAPWQPDACDAYHYFQHQGEEYIDRDRPPASWVQYLAPLTGLQLAVERLQDVG